MSSTSRLAPLHHRDYEHDACGVGLVVDIAGRASRAILDRALDGIVNLTHRGGVGADARTGDGAGIMTQLPFALFAPDLVAADRADLPPGSLGVAMTFLPVDEAAEALCRDALATAMTGQGLDVVGWREVVVHPEVLGPVALSTLPRIAQLLIAAPVGMSTAAFERALFLGRRAAERTALANGIDERGFYVVSCSSQTIIYKGFCLPRDLAAFYADLQDPAYETAIALFHQR